MKGILDKLFSKKKVVVITGCYGLLGTEFVNKFAQQFYIVGVARTKPKVINNEISFFQGDICTDAQAIISYALEKFGAIDYLINNAVYSKFDNLLSLDTTDAYKQFATNVVAPIELAQQCVKQYWQHQATNLNQRQNRAIINISSIAAINCYFGLGQAVYAACKSALNTLTMHMADEFKAYGVVVNAIAPNTFPYYVTIEAVLDSILECMCIQKTGNVKVLDQDQEYWLYDQ